MSYINPRAGVGAIDPWAGPDSPPIIAGPVTSPAEVPSPTTDITGIVGGLQTGLQSVFNLFKPAQSLLTTVPGGAGQPSTTVFTPPKKPSMMPLLLVGGGIGLFLYMRRKGKR